MSLQKLAVTGFSPLVEALSVNKPPGSFQQPLCNALYDHYNTVVKYR